MLHHLRKCTHFVKRISLIYSAMWIIIDLIVQVCRQRKNEKANITSRGRLLAEGLFSGCINGTSHTHTKIFSQV